MNENPKSNLDEIIKFNEDFTTDVNHQLPEYESGDERWSETGLRHKQYMFVQATLRGLDGKSAAIAAGYSPVSAHTTANNLLNNELVKEQLAKGRLALQQSTGITREYINGKLLEVIQDCFMDEKTDRGSMLKAYDMLAKINGLYQDINLTQNNITDNSFTIKIVKPTDGNSSH